MGWRVVTSARAETRLGEAARWLGVRGAAEQVLVLGASQAAAAELIRTVAREHGAGFGWHRTTLGRLAAELAKLEMATRGLVPVGALPVEALCARVIAELQVRGELGRLAAVAEQPGLPRALARTLGELRMAGIETVDDPTITAALVAFRAELARGRLADRATVFAIAIATATQLATTTARRGAGAERLGSPEVATGASSPSSGSDVSHPFLGLPIVAVDVAIRSRLEQQLLGAIVARAPDVLITLPAGDPTTERYLDELGLLADRADLAVEETSSLARVQKHLFERGRVNYADLDRSIEIFSAPGESRECVEIARRVVAAAADGVPFDRMAVVLRTPNHYRALLEEALARAGVPACFERGTRRPDPSGRAFLALLACAAEDLSARRFGEYVSLGEVPDARDGAPPPAAPAAERWVAPDEELSPIAPLDDAFALQHRAALLGSPVAGGTLRTPWRWERLLVEAAVIGGRDRWARRLAGLRNRLELDDSESGRDSRARQLEDLGHLERFALPLLDDLAALPREAPWGEWLDRLTALATRALREPTRVLAVLSELVPMSAVGAVGLREVQRVLYPRIADLIVKPDARRYGKLLVVPVEAIRGLAVDVVFVPGLAERMFPQKLIEDPLLLDTARAGLDLPTRDARVLDERLALRLAIGAASTRAVLSYPRIDLDQGRPRVPSFYGLEVLEAAEGALPGFDELGRKADATGAARIGWPAPADRMHAIDEAEHDLSLLDGVFRAQAAQPGRAPLAPTGVAAYLLHANPHLGRSLRFRARRWTVASWKPPDGLIAETEAGKAALAAHAPSARSFSPTALESLAQCPYRFALRTIVKLEPREQPSAIETLSPLERGSLIHDVHYELLSELRAAGRLPIASLDDVRATLDDILARVAARYRDDLCPAIDRVWDDGISAISADVREWVRRMAEDGGWTPAHFELAFGPTRRDVQDPASVSDPVDLGIGLALRGSIDLVETSEGEVSPVEGVGGEGAGRARAEARDRRRVRATDYKTGGAKVKPDVVVAGGATLQPVLYALVLEKLFPQTRVAGGRLYFCTSRGEFKVVDVALDDRARNAAQTLSDTLAHHFDKAFFPAAPVKDGCRWCEFKPICGPYEESRPKPKLDKEPLVQLSKLRSLP